MAYRYYNPNPHGRVTKDCTARALSAVLDVSWRVAFLLLVAECVEMGEYPDHNDVLWRLAQREGFKPHILLDTCPDCYTVRDFCRDHPRGEYILATGSHVVAAINGDYYDAFDSGSEIPIYYFEREG